jgi:hypothetical protein
MHRATEQLRGDCATSTVQTALDPEAAGCRSSKSTSNYRLHSFTNDPLWLGMHLFLWGARGAWDRDWMDAASILLVVYRHGAAKPSPVDLISRSRQPGKRRLLRARCPWAGESLPPNGTYCYRSRWSSGNSRETAKPSFLGGARPRPLRRASNRGTSRSSALLNSASGRRSSRC